MMRYVIILFVSVFLLVGCKKTVVGNSLIEEKLSPLVIKDSLFKEIFEKSIKELEFDIVDEDVNQYIIDFYIDYDHSNNLMLAIRNCPPIEVQNLVYLKEYHGKKVYVYYDGFNKNKVSKYIDTDDKPIKYVTLETQSSEFECIYLREFIVTDDSLIPVQSPVWN
ncbi:hypothetical protein [Myroides marinus]|uniref:hypothetical protein n=1 Tax=Myroides marinus TaxID=703342 RepID=UPI0025782D9B|nr:hypothetical protein [Myroides marinus]